MKVCALCGTSAPDDTATCPNDGEASWMAPKLTVQEAMSIEPALEEVAPEPKRGPGRPRKTS